MQGFLFEHTRPDLNGPKGRRRTLVFAVASTYDEAADLAYEAWPVDGLKLVDEGAHVLKEARENGVADDSAKAVVD